MKKFLFSLVAGMLLCAPVTNAAESTENKAPYLFVGVQGGGQTTFTNYNNTKLVMPFGAVYFGGYYNPVVGGRVHVSGWRSKGGIESLGTIMILPISLNSIPYMVAIILQHGQNQP